MSTSKTEGKVQVRCTNALQVRCIGCQAIGYVPREGWAERPCPICGRCLTDWVKVPAIKAKINVPKAAYFEQRQPEHLEGDMRELNGDLAGFTNIGTKRSLLDRDDFRGLIEWNLQPSSDCVDSGSA